MKVNPLTDAEWPGVLDTERYRAAKALNVYRVFARNEKLLQAWWPLREYLTSDGLLGARLREIAILRAAYRYGSSYELYHHKRRAAAAGLTKAEVAETQQELFFEELGATEVELIDMVDHLISDRKAIVLPGQFTSPQALEVMALVGFYGTLAFVSNTYDVAPEDKQSTPANLVSG